MKFIEIVKQYLKDYNVTDEQAKQILMNVEDDVGHNVNLIKATIDIEKQSLIKRLKKKQKTKQKEVSVAYS